MIAKLVLILNLVSGTTPCLAKTFQVAINSNSPPYAYVADGHPYGLNAEIVKLVLGQMGHSAKIEAMSDKGLIVEAEYGKRIDIVVGALPYTEKVGYLSDPLYLTEVVAISRKKDKLKIKQIEDLKEHKLAAGPWLWEKLGPEFMRQYEPKKRPPTYKEYPSRDEQHKAFWSEKAKVIVCDRVIFEFFQEYLSNLVDTTDSIVVHKLPFKSPPARVFFRNEVLRDDFNRELERLRASGHFDRLLQTHLRIQKVPKELLAQH